MSRGVDVVEALSLEDGSATAGSDAGLHCILINWTAGKNDARSHAKATELLRLIRASNAKIPIFLLADRRGIAASLTPEVATLSDEFVWLLEDTSGFIAGRVITAMERYRDVLLPPFTAALAAYNREREYSWAAPGHQGGVAFTKSAVGRLFFDFYGENLFRTDMGIERGDSARSSPTAAQSAKARSTRHGSSAPTGHTRCRPARRGPTGPSCPPASAISRSRSAIATATSPSSRDSPSRAVSRSFSGRPETATASSAPSRRNSSPPSPSQRRSRPIPGEAGPA